MRKRIGTKIYDTDKAVLVDTLDDGVQVYRKKAGALEFFLYNPTGTTTRERFFDLPAEQAEKYMPTVESQSKIVKNTSKTIRFSDYNIARIKRLARGKPMAQFILMLVDKYEAEHTDRSE